MSKSLQERTRDTEQALNDVDDRLPEYDMDGCPFNPLPTLNEICQRHGFKDFDDYYNQYRSR
jgi:hypothetical protein